MKKSKLLSIYTIIAIMVFVITLSIALPILFRPFYYLHINWLHLPQTTGYDYQTIKTAYDEMLNFCIGLTDTFSTGALKYSESGMQHFVDVKGLFLLDFALCAISGISLLVILFLRKKKIIAPAKLAYHSCNYYATVIIVAAVLFVVLISLGNFDRTFTVFHQLFFPGKTNWIFDPRTDEIINILPEVFFMNCAIAIAVNLILTRVFYLLRIKHDPL